MLVSLLSPPDPPQGASSHQDRPWHCHLVHARSQMRGLIDGRVIHVKIISDGANNYFTGVQANTNLNGDTFAALHFNSIPFHRILHSKRRVTGAHGVILMR